THPVERTVETDQPFCPAMVESNIFREKAHATPGERVTEGLAQHSTASSRRTHETHGQMNGCTFPRSVGPQETKYFTCLYGQTESVQRAQAGAPGKTAIFLNNVLELEDRGHLCSF